MDFRHLIVTCLFSMLRLSFEAQKIKENYAILWNEEPYFADLIPIIFVFTFVYSIILYAFEKAYRIQHIDYQQYNKSHVSEVIEE